MEKERVTGLGVEETLVEALARELDALRVSALLVTNSHMVDAAELV